MLTCLRATPEAALLHWLYLSRSPRSTLTALPMELAIGELSAQRLNRLARALNLEEPLERWLAEKHAFDQKTHVFEQAHIDFAPGSPQWQRHNGIYRNSRPPCKSDPPAVRQLR